MLGRFDIYSGKFGVLNYAVEGMMSSLGYTTRFTRYAINGLPVSTRKKLTWATWRCNDPEDMGVKAKYIVSGALIGTVLNTV